MEMIPCPSKTQYVLLLLVLLLLKTCFAKVLSFFGLFSFKGFKCSTTKSAIKTYP
jgi:hypothetical protein